MHRLSTHVGPILALILALNLALYLVYPPGVALAQVLTCRDVFFADRVSPLFGPEFTFTNEPIWRLGNSEHVAETPLNRAKANEIKKILNQRCLAHGDCVIIDGMDRHGENFRVLYRDGWYFQVGIDMSVLESQTKPGTLQDFLKQENRLERDLFSVAKKVGLEPHFRIGGGHIHIGADAFAQDPMTLRNFFVDYSNRPELAFGALGGHLRNSPPLAALSSSQREGLNRALDIFDRSPRTIQQFAELIHRFVYTEPLYKEWGNAIYYQAVGLSRLWNVDGSATIEMRAFRPQASLQHYRLQIELLQARINYIRTLKSPIPFKNPNRYELNNQEIVDGFYDYVTSTGLSWERYRVLLPEHLLAIEPTRQSKAN